MEYNKNTIYYCNVYWKHNGNTHRHSLYYAVLKATPNTIYIYTHTEWASNENGQYKGNGDGTYTHTLQIYIYIYKHTIIAVVIPRGSVEDWIKKNTKPNIENVIRETWKDVVNHQPLASMFLIRGSTILLFLSFRSIYTHTHTDVWVHLYKHITSGHVRTLARTQNILCFFLSRIVCVARSNDLAYNFFFHSFFMFCTHAHRAQMLFECVRVSASVCVLISTTHLAFDVIRSVLHVYVHVLGSLYVCVCAHTQAQAYECWFALQNLLFIAISSNGALFENAPIITHSKSKTQKRERKNSCMCVCECVHTECISR